MSEESKSILPQSALDRRLISAAAAHKTPEEMSEAVLGRLTPAQCIDRVKEIIASQDVWSELESRKLLLFQMQEHLDWLTENRDKEHKDMTGNSILSSIPRMMKLLSDSLDKSRINAAEVSTKLGSEHARMYVEGYTRGFEAILKLLSERGHAVVEEEEMLEIMELGVQASGKYLEKVTAKDD